MWEVREPVFWMKYPVSKESEESEIGAPEESVVDKSFTIKDPWSMERFIYDEILSILHTWNHCLNL